jgi:uncharacterized protein YbaR (Trm112 family)
MIAPDLLDILRCPETHQRLQPADASLVLDLNRRIDKGSVRNRAGDNVQEALDGGLVREDGKFLYPICKGIPILLVDGAIPLLA